MRGERGLRRSALKRGPAREHLVGHDAEGIDIHPEIHAGVTDRLLRRHVGRRAERHAGGGERYVAGRRRIGNGLGDAEIGHDGGAGGEQHVIGLDVAMHDALGVGVCQGGGHVAEEPHRLGNGQLAIAGNPGAERFPFDVGHGEVWQPQRFTDGMDRHDVGMLQLGEQEDFAAEAVATHARGEVGRQDLDGDPAAQRGLVRQEDARHPSAAELTVELVGIAERCRQLLAQIRVTPRG